MSTSAIAPLASAGAPAAEPKKQAPDSGTAGLANQNVFLQLLIAQLKHQDPSNPADGTAFVTQLAQFTTLEQTTQSRIDLDSILKAMKAATSAQPSAASKPDTGSSSTSKS